jgi:ribonuclease P protein component
MAKTVPIRKNNEFIRAYRKGSFYVGRYLILYALKNKFETNRLGITTSKKVGNSVKRNRIRRLVRENYRADEEYIKKGFDLIFVARKSELLPEFKDIKKEMKFLLKKLKIFDQERWDCSKKY